MSKPPNPPKPAVASTGPGTRTLLARFLPLWGWARKEEAVMAGNALKLAAAAIAAVGFVRAAQAHNDFTDRAEYYAATPQAPAYYEPQYYYAYPSYVEPYYSGRSIYVAPRRRWRER
ncbi:hypothetical protein MSC49_20210 [Methylosinus sp. C49]|nr:hypothetical protein MSC49_20210 [Methylosinus sp. C49]